MSSGCSRSLMPNSMSWGQTRSSDVSPIALILETAIDVNSLQSRRGDRGGGYDRRVTRTQRLLQGHEVGV